MRRIMVAAVVFVAALLTFGCHTMPDSTPCISSTAPTIVDSTPANTTTGPRPTVTVPPTTQVPVLTGWQEADGNTYYYRADGTKATGWLEVDGVRYFFAADGARYSGWLEQEEGRYYLDAGGVTVTGWLELAGVRYYLGENGLMVTGWFQQDEHCYYLQSNGAMTVGWTQIGENRHYFDETGNMCTGWLDADEHRYYLGEDGVMVTGWLQQEEKLYYLKPDGVMARGMVEIDGVKTYFTSTGDYILLVNPWNYLPEGYAPELVTLDRYNGYDNMVIAACCYDPLVQMLRDCKNQSQIAYVVSSYRTHEFQEKNYQRKVNYYLNLGYGKEEAEALAATVVAVPGTSEHQSGLAVDIVDAKLWSLEDAQADMPAQKWLMEHSWEYGFILRYPKDKTDVTGIIYEPWHYRYVGKELAAELHACGLTLEEYLDMLTAEEAA